MLRLRSVALSAAAILSLTTGAALAQTNAPEAEVQATQTAAVATTEAVPPLPIRNAVFVAKEAELKAAQAGPLQRFWQRAGQPSDGASQGGSDVSKVFDQKDRQ